MCQTCTDVNDCRATSECRGVGRKKIPSDVTQVCATRAAARDGNWELNQKGNKGNTYPWVCDNKKPDAL